MEYPRDFKEYMQNEIRTKVQPSIIEQMHVKPTIDPQKEIETRVQFLKKQLVETKRFSYILGISGGQDSTLAGKLAQMAVDELNQESEIGKDPYQFVALLLPYGEQYDIDDARKASYDFIKSSRTIEHNIKNEVDSFVHTFEESSGIKISDYNKGNYKARSRMAIQYAYAGEFQGLVIGTDHSAENTMGFFTLWGDGACDLAPLMGLNKRQGRELLKFLNAPAELYLKTPVAGLLDEDPLKTDEDSLGVTYEQLDDFLEGKEIPFDKQLRITEQYFNMDYKRKPIKTIYN